MRSRFRHIVIGSGGIGSAAAYWLSTRAPAGEVLVIEQYALGHDRGASEDHSRIIRHSYHSTDYTELTGPSYDTWHEMEALSGVALVLETGGVDLGVGEEGRVRLAAYSAALHASGHPHELLDSAQVMARWPQWRLESDVVGLYQAQAGILDIRKANAVHVALARQGGVTFAENTTVTHLRSFSDRVEVETDAGHFSAETVSLCAGSWIPPLTETLGVTLPITLTQEQVTYWATTQLRDFAPDRFGIWIYHGREKSYYGFPVYGEVGVKAGRDMSGVFVTQESRTWDPNPDQRDDLTAFMAAHLPGALGPEMYTKTCVYDMPPDRDFLIDTLPGNPRVAVFCGAGHAAKFASLMGKILADLAVTGGTDYPIKAFRADRPALTDPAYPSDFRFAAGAAATASSPAPTSPSATSPSATSPSATSPSATSPSATSPAVALGAGG